MSLCPGRTAHRSVFSCIRRRKRQKAASTASIPTTSSMKSRRGRSRLRTADENGRRSAVRARHILRISSVIRKLSRNRDVGRHNQVLGQSSVIQNHSRSAQAHEFLPEGGPAVCAPRSGLNLLSTDSLGCKKSCCNVV